MVPLIGVTLFELQWSADRHEIIGLTASNSVQERHVYGHVGAGPNMSIRVSTNRVQLVCWS